MNKRGEGKKKEYGGGEIKIYGIWDERMYADQHSC